MARRPRPLSVFRDLLAAESASGILLIAAAALAMLVANSPLSAAYFGVLHTYVGGLSILHWIDDALMAVFFLLVGLEIKRELADGQLSTWSRRALPGLAAIGGMVAPALVYLFFVGGDPALTRGWAIPAATDIAFALGVLAMLGSRVPVSLKIFLTALAILDDLGAVLIIAFFYTADLDVAWLGWAALPMGLGLVLARFGVGRLLPYLLLGVVLWLCVQRSGVHPTIAGVALAMVVPVRRSPGRPDDAESPLHRLEHALQPWVAYLILPVFAFTNAGVDLSGVGLDHITDPLPVGIAAGLFLGKQIGVFGATWAAVRSGLAPRPEDASWGQIYGVAILCGIGFTMSLFIGNLAFAGSALLEAEMKAGIIIGSLVSALAGAAVLLIARRRVALSARG